MRTEPDILTVARAEALFTSTLPTDTHPTRAEAVRAIRIALRSHGGVHGCTQVLAGEYGDHPETAAPRMRWARGVVDAIFGPRRDRVPGRTVGRAG